MNQLCKVCGEPAAGFHFGAFTCEGCKSFFGRTYNNIGAISACKNGGDCVINKKNRTACKACRLHKCLHVGMSKSGSRYGRRSNWFKIHCLLQEQQTQNRTSNSGAGAGGDGGVGGVGSGNGSGSGNGNDEQQLTIMERRKVNIEQLAHLHQLQVRQTHQDKMNPFINAISRNAATTTFLPTILADNEHIKIATTLANQSYNQKLFTDTLSDSRIRHDSIKSVTTESHHCNAGATDSDASTVSDLTIGRRTKTDIKRYRQQQYENHQKQRNCSSEHQRDSSSDDSCDREQQFLELFRSNSEPLEGPFITFVSATNRTTPAFSNPAQHSPTLINNNTGKSFLQDFDDKTVSIVNLTGNAHLVQDEPIDLSLKSRDNCDSQMLHIHDAAAVNNSTGSSKAASFCGTTSSDISIIVDRVQKHVPLDLTLLRDD